jgi:selenoprotein W-related protein
VVGVVELVTGAGGIFDVHVDGELVFEKKMLGRYPDPDDVLPLLREKL